MEVVVGTYEQLLLGYTLLKTDKDYELKNSFTDHSHTGIVRTVAVSDRGILASGSSDEVVKLFNLAKRKELGTLMHHEGSINQVVFYGKDSMFSCSDDGTLGIWRVGQWECIRTLRGHKGPVYSVSVHPSGKMALSVSHDKTMRTWNLITGKCAYITNIKQAADFIQWTPSGDRYFVVLNTTADLYSVETASVVKTFNCGFKIHAIVFIEDSIMAIAGDKGVVQFYTVPDGDKIYEFATDTARIKGMKYCTYGQDNMQLLITGSSDGHIKVWKLTKFEDEWSSSVLTSMDTKFRIISLAVNMSSVCDTKDTVKSKLIDESIDNESDSENSMTSSENDIRSDSSDDVTDSSDNEVVVKQPQQKVMKQNSKEKSQIELKSVAPPNLNSKQRRELRRKKEKQDKYLAAKKQERIQSLGSTASHIAKRKTKPNVTGNPKKKKVS